MRVDKPELQCDRCKTSTLDTGEMANYQTLHAYSIGGEKSWDLCPECRIGFHNFLQNRDTPARPRPAPVTMPPPKSNDPHSKDDEVWTVETLNAMNYEVLVHAAMLHDFKGKLLRYDLTKFLVGLKAWL